MNQPVQKMDTEVARHVAAKLIGAADGFEPLRNKARQLTDTFRRESSLNTDNQQPAPFFSPLDAALNKGLEKITTDIAQVQRNILTDAADIAQLADGIEDIAATAAAKLNSISAGNA